MNSCRQKVRRSAEEAVRRFIGGLLSYKKAPQGVTLRCLFLFFRCDVQVTAIADSGYAAVVAGGIGRDVPFTESVLSL